MLIVCPSIKCESPWSEVLADFWALGQFISILVLLVAGIFFGAFFNQHFHNPQHIVGVCSCGCKHGRPSVTIEGIYVSALDKENKSIKGRMVGQ